MRAAAVRVAAESKRSIVQLKLRPIQSGQQPFLSLRLLRLSPVETGTRPSIRPSGKEGGGAGAENAGLPLTRVSGGSR